MVETTGDLQLDGRMLQPLVSTGSYPRSAGGPAVLYVNADNRPTPTSPRAPGTGFAWTPDGRRRNPVGAGVIRLPNGGFAVTT